jgi:queuine tRNA-ribosyltransferase
MKSDESWRLGDYEVHRAREGFSSIRQISSGEIMHSRTDPMEEARQLYVEQARLTERLRERSAEPLILWDVGLGAAANALAAIECYEGAKAERPLHVISFENDLDPFRLAAAHIESFPYLRSELVNTIIGHGEWRADDEKLIWKLRSGDFLATMNNAPAPDIIFYDMFSPKVSPELWTTGVFRNLFDICHDRPTELFTYTCSTANRAALLAAGFFVARGRNAGEKIETTIAFTPMAVRHPVARRDLLSLDWLARWERSAAKFPADVAPNEWSAFAKSIRGHEQFRNSARLERLPFTT